MRTLASSEISIGSDVKLQMSKLSEIIAKVLSKALDKEQIQRDGVH